MNNCIDERTLLKIAGSDALNDYYERLSQNQNADLGGLIEIHNQYAQILNDTYQKYKQVYHTDLEHALEGLKATGQQSFSDQILDIILDNNREEDDQLAHQVYYFVMCFRSELPTSFINLFDGLIKNEFSLTISEREVYDYVTRNRILCSFDYTNRATEKEYTDYNTLRKVLCSYIDMSLYKPAIQMIEMMMLSYPAWKDELQELVIALKVNDYNHLPHRDKVLLEREVAELLYNDLDNLTYLSCHVYMGLEVYGFIDHVTVKDITVVITVERLATMKPFIIQNHMLDIFIKSKIKKK